MLNEIDLNYAPIKSNGWNSMLMLVGRDGRIVLMVKANGPGYKLSILTDLVHFSA